MANYDTSILIERIIDDLECEMTILNNYYEFDDCVVKVVGRISQDYDYTPPTYDTPEWKDLDSRYADLDSIEIYDEHGEREMTSEELWYITKQLEI